MRFWCMGTGMSLTVSSIDRQRLSALFRDRNAPQMHIWRVEIILLSSDGIGTVEIMRQTGNSKTCVWRWQECFAAEGFEGLLRDRLDNRALHLSGLKPPAWWCRCRTRRAFPTPCVSPCRV